MKIACFGLAFKPNIDDLRESPAMGIAQSIARWHSGDDGADIDDLKVTKIFVDEGPSMKRIMPRAKGRADRILKRTSH
ncbi:hypothetical protein ONR49_25925, partial [Salmonella enterica subsp. enterica serovar Virginia]|nr:hypothetical protein [Salmonella enterica subsp. enterica serovar Virginia]